MFNFLNGMWQGFIGRISRLELWKCLGLFCSRMCQDIYSALSYVSSQLLVMRSRIVNAFSRLRQ